jgi:hypothetical protein
MNIDEYETEVWKVNYRPRYNVTSLLSSPLPTELRTVENDLLILMAVYYGNIDRSARLRREKLITNEIQRCVHGIYHNTMFAVWWSRQTMPEHSAWRLRKAINARFIMNNVLSTSMEETNELPYLMWYPTVAHPSTYRELGRRKPEMKPQVLRACIVANYKDLFDELLNDLTPDQAMVAEASVSWNPYYKEAL